MKLFKLGLTLIAILLLNNTLKSQHFSEPFMGASYKKITYITMEDGTEIKGTLKKLKLEKGLIEEIKIKDLNDQKMKIKPAKIKYMYVPLSNLGKYASAINFSEDATRWASTDIKTDIISKGYAYFEKSQVKIKKKTETLMLELLNPTFSSKIKVYTDPLAKETASLGVGGIKVAGGKAKSYYVKKGDDVAYRLKKKNYPEEFKLFFSDCPALIEKYGDNPKWSDFEMHVFEYTKDCN